MTRFLAVCRYLMVIPVIGCVLLTAGVVVMGMGRILAAGASFIRAGDFSAKSSKTMSVAVIEIIDLFLVGTVANKTTSLAAVVFVSCSYLIGRVIPWYNGDPKLKLVVIKFCGLMGFLWRRSMPSFRYAFSLRLTSPSSLMTMVA